MAEPFGVAPHMNSEIGISDIRVCLQTMREVENSGRVFDAGSGYVKHRRLLVDWICECGDSHSLASSTSHVAVGLMDKVLQAVDVKRDRYQMVALTCLVLAAKYEEKEESVPSMRRLYEYVEKRQGQKAAQMCEAHRVNNMEVLILNTLGWKITIVTPLHYLGVFERMGVVYSSDTLGYKPLLPKIVRYMKKYMHFFADLCLQDYGFHMWSPSLLAAALVVASRKALNIRPLWSSPAMDSSLGYSFAAVAPVFQAVWAHYKGQFPREAVEAMELEAETDAEHARAGAASAAAAAAAATASAAAAVAASTAAAAAAAEVGTPLGGGGGSFSGGGIGGGRGAFSVVELGGGDRKVEALLSSSSSSSSSAFNPPIGSSGSGSGGGGGGGGGSSSGESLGGSGVWGSGYGASLLPFPHTFLSPTDMSGRGVGVGVAAPASAPGSDATVVLHGRFNGGGGVEPHATAPDSAGSSNRSSGGSEEASSSPPPSGDWTPGAENSPSAPPFQAMRDLGILSVEKVKGGEGIGGGGASSSSAAAAAAASAAASAAIKHSSGARKALRFTHCGVEGGGSGAGLLAGPPTSAMAVGSLEGFSVIRDPSFQLRGEQYLGTLTHAVATAWVGAGAGAGAGCAGEDSLQEGPPSGSKRQKQGQVGVFAPSLRPAQLRVGSYSSSVGLGCEVGTQPPLSTSNSSSILSPLMDPKR